MLRQSLAPFISRKGVLLIGDQRRDWDDCLGAATRSLSWRPDRQFREKVGHHRVEHAQLEARFDGFRASQLELMERPLLMLRSRETDLSQHRSLPWRRVKQAEAQPPHQALLVEEAAIRGSRTLRSLQIRRKRQHATRPAGHQKPSTTSDQRGQRYYRQGSRAISDVDGNTATALFAAGAVGFALAWLIFAQRSYSADYVTRGMSKSSDRYD